MNAISYPRKKAYLIFTNCTFTTNANSNLILNFYSTIIICTLYNTYFMFSESDHDEGSEGIRQWMIN